jgi:pimeloyl-ACP methyl ester carboxylesterase
MNYLSQDPTSPLERREYRGITFWLSSERPHARQPTVVFLHGLGNSLDFWTAVAPIVGGTAQVVAIDIPGFGKSRPPKPEFSLPVISKLTWDLVRHIGAQSVLIVGHSLGGYIALGLAKDAAVPVRAITLVSATLSRAEALCRNPWLAVHSPGLSLALFAQFAGSTIPFSSFTAKLVAGNRYSRQVFLWPFVASPERLESQLAVRALSGNSGRSIGATLGLTRTTRVSDLAQGLLQPVALVWGDRDPLISSKDIVYGRSMLKPRSELCLPDCGHWPMLEKPQLLADFILSELLESL